MSEALLRAIADLEARLRMLERLEMPTVSGGGAGAPASATYLTLEAEAVLSAERRLVPAARLTGTDAGPNNTYTLDLAASGVTPGTYGSATQVAQVTIDTYGRVTAAANVAIANAGFFSWSGSGITTAQTVLPAGTVTRVVTVLYAAAEETGADTGGGTATLTPGDTFNIVVDGTNTCALACTAGGAVTIARTAGADSYAARLFMEWI